MAQYYRKGGACLKRLANGRVRFAKKSACRGLSGLGGRKRRGTRRGLRGLFGLRGHSCRTTKGRFKKCR